MTLRSQYAMLMIAIGVSACAQHEWRGPVAEPCNILLINETGGVHVSAGFLSSRAPLLTSSSKIFFESETEGGQTTLTVKNPKNLNSIDVDFKAPPHCTVAVRTTKGNVTVSVGPRTPTLKVDTTTGNIILQIGPHTDAEILMATSGEITTDYTIDIEFQYHEEPAKYGRVITGKGLENQTPDISANIRLRSLRGAVRVLRPDQAAHRN